MYSMINLKSERELAQMRAAGRIVAACYEVLREKIQPGVTLRELDECAEHFIRQQRARPLYKGYCGSRDTLPPFPAVICSAVNEEICHGIPNERALEEGDIVGIDIGLRYGAFCADSCVTFPVGQLSPDAERLLHVARECMETGIRAAQPMAYLNDIGAAIEAHARAHGMSVVRDLTGHGIGRALHEMPTVFHTRRLGRGPRIRPGMVFTVEPMVTLGSARHRTLGDGWTEVTVDGKLSAQFEHTIAITPDGPEILTRL